MTSNKAIIHKFVYLALVDIREAAYIAKDSKIFHFADLIHNLSLQIEGLGDDDNYDELLKRLIDRETEKDTENWIENKIQEIKESLSSCGAS